MCCRHMQQREWRHNLKVLLGSEHRIGIPARDKQTNIPIEEVGLKTTPSAL